ARFCGRLGGGISRNEPYAVDAAAPSLAAATRKMVPGWCFARPALCLQPDGGGAGHRGRTFTYVITPILAQAKGVEKAQGGDYLPVIVVTRQHAATLRYLRQQLPALRGQRLNPEQSFVLSTTGPAGPIIV
nr:hypothetical protein [Tanacetum cinerariifolium]